MVLFFQFKPRRNNEGLYVENEDMISKIIHEILLSYECFPTKGARPLDTISSSSQSVPDQTP